MKRTYRDKDGDLWREADDLDLVSVDDMAGRNPGAPWGIPAVRKLYGPLVEVVTPAGPVEANGKRYAYGQAGGGFVDSVLMDAPESWDSDDGAEHVALSYVATLEARMDAAGLSRERWVAGQE